MGQERSTCIFPAGRRTAHPGVIVLLLLGAAASAAAQPEADNTAAARREREEMAKQMRALEDRMKVMQQELLVARDREAAARQQAQANARAAEARFQQARSAVDAFNRQAAERKQSAENENALRRLLLEEAKRFYEQVANQPGDDSEVRRQAKRSLARIARAIAEPARAEDDMPAPGKRRPEPTGQSVLPEQFRQLAQQVGQLHEQFDEVRQAMKAMHATLQSGQPASSALADRKRLEELERVRIAQGRRAAEHADPRQMLAALEREQTKIAGHLHEIAGAIHQAQGHERDALQAEFEKAVGSLAQHQQHTLQLQAAMLEQQLKKIRGELERPEERRRSLRESLRRQLLEQ